MGFHSNVGVKVGYPLKKTSFANIGFSSVKQWQIGTDVLLIITNTGQGHFSFINIDDLKRP